MEPPRVLLRGHDRPLAEGLAKALPPSAIGAWQDAVAAMTIHPKTKLYTSADLGVQ